MSPERHAQARGWTSLKHGVRVPAPDQGRAMAGGAGGRAVPPCMCTRSNWPVTMMSGGEKQSPAERDAVMRHGRGSQTPEDQMPSTCHVPQLCPALAT